MLHEDMLLKIAMIGHKRIPSREGGVEIVVNELSRRIARMGHKVTVYNRGGHHVSGKEYDVIKNNKDRYYQGVKIVTVPSIELRGLAALTSSFFATLKAIFHHYDCIHFHAEGPSVMLIIPHFLRIKTVVTIHGLDWKRAKWGGFAVKYLKLGEKIAAKYADEIIVLSKSVQAYFKETYRRDTVFIPNGIDKPRLRDPDIINYKWGLDKDDYILFLGRIVPEKGLRYLIEAYKRIDTDKKLVVAGGASDTDDYFQEIRSMAADNVNIIFTGFVQGQVLEELYSNAYIYILPSDLEGMPISLLEAMSYGNCCIVSDIAECTEVVEDKAIVFHMGDVDDLMNKLKAALYDHEKVMMLKSISSNFICNKYDWDEIVKETLALYMD